MATYTGVCWTTITVYTTPSSFVLANIYSDVGMTTPTANPFPCFGRYTFYAAANQYVIQGDFTQLIGGGGGSGTVTNTGTLTDHAVIVGNGGVDVSALASLGSTTTVLHGNASGDPTFGAVVEADITLADNTTNNVSTTKHGFAPKAPNDVTKYLDGTGAYSVPAVSGVGLLLAYTVYAPGSQQTLTTTSATFADLDATNLAVTFTAPASGKVIVRLSGYADVSINIYQYRWGLRESTTNIANSGGVVQRGQDGQFLSMPIYIAGISAGSHTYKWSHATSGGTGRTIVYDGQSNFAPAIMEVWSA